MAKPISTETLQITRVDRTSSTPLYIQVYEQLFSIISSDEISNTNYFLPSERILASQFEVDRLTLRKALSKLEDKGLIKKRSGARTIITKLPVASSNSISHNVLWLLPRGYDYIDRINEPFNILLFNHIERLVTEEGYNLIYKSFSEDEEPSKILNTMDFDGVFFVSNVAPKMMTATYLAGIPGVVLNSFDNKYPCVLGDRLSGVEQALDHLIELGHRKIAFIGGTPGYTNSELSLKGYQETLHKHGIEIETTYMETGFWSYTGGYKAMQKILTNSTVRPTALFAADDSMAFGAHKALRDKRLFVPKDMSIVGYDNLDVPGYSTIELTTVDLDLYSLATSAWWTLKNQLSGGKILNSKTILPVKLVIRESTAAVSNII